MKIGQIFKELAENGIEWCILPWSGGREPIPVLIKGLGTPGMRSIQLCPEEIFNFDDTVEDFYHSIVAPCILTLCREEK